MSIVLKYNDSIIQLEVTVANKLNSISIPFKYLLRSYKTRQLL